MTARYPAARAIGRNGAYRLSASMSSMITRSPL
jgi:hypothetical protein